MLADDGATKAPGDLAQFGSSPPPRFHFMLEKVLDLNGVRRGPAGLQDGANMRGNVLGRFRGSRHNSKKQLATSEKRILHELPIPLCQLG